MSWCVSEGQARSRLLHLKIDTTYLEILVFNMNICISVMYISALAKRQFVKNPKDLQGEVFTTRLLKGDRGLGFTIIGGDNPDEEFLQIKNVVRNGPAFVDGKLQTGMCNHTM